MSKSKSFDPYLEWLKVPADKRPPTYYALLGVEDFEEDLDKIEESFQELYSKVRRYQVGDHSGDAIRILTEMSRAYDCLTSPHHKKKYDRELRGGDGGEPGEAEAPVTTQAKKKAPAKVELLEDEPDSAPAPLTAGGLQVLGEADASAPTATIGGAAPAPVPVAAPQAAPQAAPSSYENVWYIQTPDGRRLGPATQQQLDEVVAHRRVNPMSMVWRVGWPEAKPVLQMFPELKPASGPGSVGPYHRLQVRPEVEQSRKAIFFVVLLLGVAAAGVGLFYGFAFTFNFFLMAFIGAVGAAALAAGLMEMGALMNSPPLMMYRQRLGDEPTRKLFVYLGGMCVFVSLSMITWQAVTHMASSVRGISRNVRSGVGNMARMPSVPSIPGTDSNSGGSARPGARPNRNSGGSSPGSFIPSVPGLGGGSAASSGADAGSSESAAIRGNPPIIRGFDTYALTPNGQLMINGSGFNGTTKVVFARPGNAKSRAYALGAKFEIKSDQQLAVTVPLQIRFGSDWICEVRSNGGVAVSIPPKTPVVAGRGDIPRPRSIFRVTGGAEVMAVNNSIAIFEGQPNFRVMMFSRVYFLDGIGRAPRNPTMNVLVGDNTIDQLSGTNTKIVAGRGISVFQQPTAFTTKR